MRFAVALVLVCASLVVPSSAIASRAPTDAEKATILTAFGAWSDANCYAVRVSTIDEGWATVRFAAAFPGESLEDYLQRCNPADGLTVMAFSGEVWEQVVAGSDFAFCPVAGVPTDVAVDLKVCRVGKVFAFYGTSFRFKPRTLPISAHAVLAKLRWRDWGKPTATATGLFDYADAYDKYRVRVRVRASRVRVCQDRRVYHRVAITPVASKDRSRVFGGGNIACD